MSDNSELHRTLGRLEGKQDLILQNQSNIHKMLDRHEEEIKKINGKIFWFSGAVASIIVIAANAIKWFKPFT